MAEDDLPDVRVHWSIGGAPDFDDFFEIDRWADVREIIRRRRPDPKPGPHDIQVRSRFSRARRPMADMCANLCVVAF